MNGYGFKRHLEVKARAGRSMAAMTKREGAQRILDAQATAEKMKSRAVMGALVILIVALAVTILSRWQFGLATLLLLGLLLQYAMERLTTMVEASVAHGFKAMGWPAESELNDETLEKIHRVLNP